MNGLHDIGGMQGLGPVPREADEPVFHAEWEKRVFALMVSTLGGGAFNAGEFRHAVNERIDQSQYLTLDYYERWIQGIEMLLIEKGLITQDELKNRFEKLSKEVG
tara:strand:+ start:1751 stop:2065 length:315 start_codon:yes stop_codon:yes gene_type:complete